MPTAPLNGKILVSGVTGFIAAWVADRLLHKGYSVRGTVRSKEKGAKLAETFKERGFGADKFEYVVVKDIAEKGAFDEAVKGVDAIEHVASPYHVEADDPQDLIAPAVNGTVGILESALKYAPTVKRVVITSSCAAVRHEDTKPILFTEEDWNEQSILIVEKEGRAAPNIIKYRASKTLAEKAAWKFMENHKDEISWDLVAINPPFVFGPMTHPVASRADLNTSTSDFLSIAISADAKGHTKEQLATQGSSWIDVRDLGEAHALALEKAEAGGQRIIVSVEAFVWQDWRDIASCFTFIPGGCTGAGKSLVHLIQYDTSKAERIFGLKYRTMGETARDVWEDYNIKGLVGKGSTAAV
ncbi:hypothetical protein HGRIS_003059 [Hohenbuehelia grisea]|uniref:NAD-dependent epimerase/dehydratase domain-containing protein n=1 Tax=Hohenbuehelia grisea TaxID=104357 RepID=A0ABR3JMB2_9AGAR